VASSGKWFGSPDGSPERGFNELNGWVAAWGPSGGGVRIALMPGITPPDSTGTGAKYTVELNNVQIGTLTVSGGIAWVSITGTMPDFMEVARIWLEPGGYILYDNGPRPAVVLAPGTYQVKATLRVKPRPDIYGRAANLTLSCGGTPIATITVRVPNPEEWGIRADIYTFTSPSWPPFGSGYTYKGTWSVGAIYFWLYGVPVTTTRLVCRRRTLLGFFVWDLRLSGWPTGSIQRRRRGQTGPSSSLVVSTCRGVTSASACGTTTAST
jgi:hypothetical protein